MTKSQSRGVRDESYPLISSQSKIQVIYIFPIKDVFILLSPYYTMGQEQRLKQNQEEQELGHGILKYSDKVVVLGMVEQLEKGSAQTLENVG